MNRRVARLEKSHAVTKSDIDQSCLTMSGKHVAGGGAILRFLGSDGKAPLGFEQPAYPVRANGGSGSPRPGGPQGSGTGSVGTECG